MLKAVSVFGYNVLKSLNHYRARVYKVSFAACVYQRVSDLFLFQEKIRIVPSP